MTSKRLDQHFSKFLDSNQLHPESLSALNLPTSPLSSSSSSSSPAPSSGGRKRKTTRTKELNDDEQDLKRQRRKQQNRNAAHASRQRKKEYVSELETQVHLLKEAKEALEKQVASLQQQNQSLQQQLHAAASLQSPSSAPFSSSPSSPSSSVSGPAVPMAPETVAQVCTPHTSAVGGVPANAASVSGAPPPGPDVRDEFGVADVAVCHDRPALSAVPQFGLGLEPQEIPVLHSQPERPSVPSLPATFEFGFDVDVDVSFTSIPSYVDYHLETPHPLSSDTNRHSSFQLDYDFDSITNFDLSSPSPLFPLPDADPLSFQFLASPSHQQSSSHLPFDFTSKQVPPVNEWWSDHVFLPLQ